MKKVQSKSKEELCFEGSLNKVLDTLKNIKDIFIIRIHILANENEISSNISKSLEKIQRQISKDANLEWDVSYNKNLQEPHFKIFIPLKKQVSLR